MADKWFFDDDQQTRSPGLVQAAERSAHSWPVHDCRILVLSDNISIVLCFKPRTIARLHRDQTFRLGVSGAQHQGQHQMDTERVQQQ